MTDLLWQYFLIFIMAATPWLEILVVIPVGVGMGLSPVWVGIVSFTGNFLPIILIVLLLKWFRDSKWLERWRGKKRTEQHGVSKNNLEKSDDNRTAIVTEEHTEEKAETLKKRRKSKRNEKAARIFHKYGLPGLAVLGPAVTGIHLAAVIALGLKAGKLKTTLWMGASLLVWTVFLTIASYYSIDWVTGMFS